MLRIKKEHEELEGLRRCDRSKNWTEDDKDECGKGGAFWAAEISAIPAWKLFGTGQRKRRTKGKQELIRMPCTSYKIQQPGNILVFFHYHAVLLDLGDKKSCFLGSNKKFTKSLILHMIIMTIPNKGQEHQVFLGKCPCLQWQIENPAEKRVCIYTGRFQHLTQCTVLWNAESPGLSTPLQCFSM